MRNLLLSVFSITLLTMMIGCKKDAAPETKVDTGKLIMFSSENLANAEDTLMAVYTRVGGTENYSLYGSFDNKGLPKKVKEVVVNKNDTAINFIMDDSNRVKTIFCTVKQIKDSAVFFVGYENKKITLTRAIFYWATNTHKITSAVTVNMDSLGISNLYKFAGMMNPNHNQYVGAGAGNICAIGFSPSLFLLQCATGISNQSTAFTSATGFAGALASTLGVTAAYVASTCAIGGLAGGPIGAAIGCAVGIADAIKKTSNALQGNTPTSTTTSCSYEQLPSDNTSSSPQPKVVSKESPQKSLTGTELDKEYGLSIGYSTEGPVNNFNAACAENSKAQMRNLVIDLKTFRGFAGITSCSFKCTYYFAYGNTTLGGPYYYGNPAMRTYEYNPQFGLYTIYFTNPYTAASDRLVGSVLADGRSFAGIFYFSAGYSCNDGVNRVAQTQTNIYIKSVN